MSDDIPTCGGHVEVRKRQAIRDQIPSGRENAADLRINDIPGRYFRPRTEPDDVRTVELDEDGSVYVGDIGSVRSVKALEPTRPADCYSAALHRFMEHPTPETWEAARWAGMDLQDWLMAHRAWGSSGPHLHFESPPPRRRLRWPARWRR